MTYRLIDSGEQKKLEQFGPYTLIRPCSQAVWRPHEKLDLWNCAHAKFDREEGWQEKKKMEDSWVIDFEGIKFQIAPTEFGHLGLFPEHAALWRFIEKSLKKRKGATFLNLFAYSGGASLAAAKAGAKVCHLDASPGMVSWAKENAKLNSISTIRWIVDDALKFVKREKKRGSRYDAILLDPPTFGRGSQKEVFKIERDLPILLEILREILTEDPLFFALTCHTPGFTPTVLRHLLYQYIGKKEIECGELLLGEEVHYPVPSGSYARLIF